MELSNMNKKEKIETYDKEAVEAVKKILEGGANSGSPYYYKIQIDGLKVVDRTSDLSKFDSYELFLNGAEELVLYIYASQNTPNYLLKRTFQMQTEKTQQPQALNGMELEGIITTKVNERVSIERERWDGDLIKKDLDATKLKLSEAETYIDLLETQIGHFKSKKLHLGDINLGELASVVVEGMIRRNPQMLSKLPGGNALAGVIEMDNKEREEQVYTEENHGEATFKKKTSSLTEDEQRYVKVIQQMEESFDQEELEKVMGIIQRFASNTSEIDTVAELLDLPIKKTEQQNAKV
jgi:hypothetical protein